MPNFPYLLPRLVRHFMPERLTRFLLLRSIVIRPGLESTEPASAVLRYIEVLEQQGRSIRGGRVLVFGYGGRFDVGIGLLEAGAGHVVLCERYAPPDDLHNAGLLPRYGRYLVMQDGRPRPRPEAMTLLQADIQDVQPSAAMPPADYVFSNS